MRDRREGTGVGPVRATGRGDRRGEERRGKERRGEERRGRRTLRAPVQEKRAFAQEVLWDVGQFFDLVGHDLCVCY